MDYFAPRFRSTIFYIQFGDCDGGNGLDRRVLRIAISSWVPACAGGSIPIYSCLLISAISAILVISVRSCLAVIPECYPMWCTGSVLTQFVFYLVGEAISSLAMVLSLAF